MKHGLRTFSSTLEITLVFWRKRKGMWMGRLSEKIVNDNKLLYPQYGRHDHHTVGFDTYILFLICSQCFFSMESANNKTNFLSQMNSSFGSGGMSLSMKDIQFVGFILHLK